MSDRMRPIPFPQLMDWIFQEYSARKTIFGVEKLYRAPEGKALKFFGEKLETPIGPAAGPHTQLAQNIIAAYAAGGRFFELKTVQVLDGEDLPVPKPCITAADECYNCEWSTELRVPQAMEEYIKAWFAIKLISREFELGDPEGFIFNMSVGYDMEGIRSGKIDGFIEGLKNAENTEIFNICRDWAIRNIHRFSRIDTDYVNQISPLISDSITLSTLHGCPSRDIERIAAYLIREKGLHTFVKCNPTLLGYKVTRETLNRLGFDYLVFDDFHFNDDLQYEEAVPMFRRLQNLAGKEGLWFGVKLTNTLPVAPQVGELPAGEMYMSGRSLYPLTIALAEKLTREFEGKLRISFAGGADAFNAKNLFDVGIWPITMVTTLLKPGGYNRLRQMADMFVDAEYTLFSGVDVEKTARLAADALISPHYRKEGPPKPVIKINRQVPLMDCFAAPCRDGCPIGQDIPGYIRLAGEGRYLEALQVITHRNPLPFTTGSICPQPCRERCNRLFYDEGVDIRGTKLRCAEKAFKELIWTIKPPEGTGKKVAVAGGGAAGLASAFLLARSGCDVTVFEKSNSLGGILRHVIPEFRLSREALDRDIELCRAAGVKFRLGYQVRSVQELKSMGFDAVVLCLGALKPGVLPLKYGSSINAIEFLKSFNAMPNGLRLGKNVAVIGGGNTAVDAARAALRVPGVESVSLVYRRTKRYMPAHFEELKLALEEGVKLCELLSPVGVSSGVLECRKIALGEPEADGRRRPVETPETVQIPADTVIAAVGEQIDRDFLTANGIKTDSRGRAVTNPATLETSQASVYIAGDGRCGPSTVVEAIADAARVASAITGADLEKYVHVNVAPSQERVREKKGVLITGCTNCDPSRRCLECATVCENCVDVCPNRANISVSVKGRPQIVHIDGMCNECGNCETFCPYDSAPYKHKFTLFWSEEDFGDSANQGFLPLENGKYEVRLGGKTQAVDIISDNAGLPRDIAALIRTVETDYAHLLHK
ncbi:MAG TPA: putative selenate reductase subunit YgfK [Clostridiales bacterium]|nr:putative selenate reductase subunit YgfK [Clostridiales bacterium]